MKDSSGAIFSLSLFLNAPDKPLIFAGEDSVLATGLMQGACGGIGATYNIMPHLFVALWDSFRADKLEEVGRIQARINQLIDALLLVDLFAGLKQVLAWMGLECGGPRTPNRLLSKGETAKLRHSLEAVGFFEET